MINDSAIRFSGSGKFRQTLQAELSKIVNYRTLIDQCVLDYLDLSAGSKTANCDDQDFRRADTAPLQSETFLYTIICVSSSTHVIA